MKKHKTLLEILVAARKKIASPKRWTQGAWAELEASVAPDKEWEKP